MRVGACGGGKRGEGEVGGREKGRGRGGTGWGLVGLAVARERKRAAAKNLAATRFQVRRYC